MKDFIEGLKVVIIAGAVVAAAWLVRPGRYEIVPVTPGPGAYRVDRYTGEVVVITVQRAYPVPETKETAAGVADLWRAAK